MVAAGVGTDLVCVLCMPPWHSLERFSCPIGLIWDLIDFLRRDKVGAIGQALQRWTALRYKE
jgi:hypothetical protein